MSLWMKSYGVTIQMKRLCQYLYTVLLVFQHVTKENLKILTEFDFSHFLE